MSFQTTEEVRVARSLYIRWRSSSFQTQERRQLGKLRRRPSTTVYDGRSVMMMKATSSVDVWGRTNSPTSYDGACSLVHISLKRENGEFGLDSLWNLRPMQLDEEVRDATESPFGWRERQRGNGVTVHHWLIGAVETAKK